MGKGARLGVALVLFALAAVGLRLRRERPARVALDDHLHLLGGSEPQVNVTMEVVGSYGLAPHPTWVSYLIQNPQTKQWVHTTIFQVPPSTRVNMTIYQFDSGSPLRNQQLGQVTGTIGNQAMLKCSDPTQAAPCGTTFKAINANAGNGVGHTFSIPTLGISVPLVRQQRQREPVRGRAVPPELDVLPAQHRHLLLHRARRARGATRGSASCPAALGWLFGNAGPMQTVGYMGGFMKIA